MVLAAMATTATPASGHVPWPAPPRHRAACNRRGAPALCKLHWWTRRTWSLERARGIHRTRYWFAAERHPQWAPWLERRVAWRARARRVSLIPVSPWPPGWLSDILCVHRGEGAWTDETGNGYHGGLQMDSSFEQTYGSEFYARWGDAGHWPPIDQITAAWRAYQTRGFSPWPNTAAMCGLL